ALALHPGPALSGFENQHVVAIQELSVDAGICPGRLANVSHRNGNAGGAAGHEAIGRDLPLQADISEIGAKGMQARVAGGHFFTRMFMGDYQMGRSSALAMIASPKRST